MVEEYGIISIDRLIDMELGTLVSVTGIPRGIVQSSISESGNRYGWSYQFNLQSDDKLDFVNCKAHLGSGKPTEGTWAPRVDESEELLCLLKTASETDFLATIEGRLINGDNIHKREIEVHKIKIHNIEYAVSRYSEKD